jgi:hypothetical protein
MSDSLDLSQAGLFLELLDAASDAIICAIQEGLMRGVTQTASEGLSREWLCICPEKRCLMIGTISSQVLRRQLPQMMTDRHNGEASWQVNDIRNHGDQREKAYKI